MPSRLPAPSPEMLPRFIQVRPRIAHHSKTSSLRTSTAHSRPRGSEHHTFRVTRNEDVEVEEDDAENLLKALERELMRRRFGPPVRPEVEHTIDEHVLDLLLREPRRQRPRFRPAGPLDLTGLWTLVVSTVMTRIPRLFRRQTVNQQRSRRRQHQTYSPPMKHGDVLLHHPARLFSTSVQRFLEQAANDRKGPRDQADAVSHIRRLPIVDACVDEAAHAGKQVLALVEIKARFDEEANIRGPGSLSGRRHVVYAWSDLKTHRKPSMVVRDG